MSKKTAERLSYYLGNIYRRLFNPSYLGCFSVDFKKQGAFRKLLSISFHMPPSALFYLFSFRNGKRSRKTIRIRHQEKWNHVLGFMTARHISLPFRFILFRPFCRVFFLFPPFMLRLSLGQRQAIWMHAGVEKSRYLEQVNRKTTWKQWLRKLALKVWKTITPEYPERLYQSIPRRMAAVIAAHGGRKKY